MEKLWDAYCGADWEPNEQPDKSAASQAASEVQSTMKPQLDPLIEKHAALKLAANALQSNGATRMLGEGLLKEIDKEFERIQRVKKNGYRGANHPLIQYAMEYGKDQHKDMESKYNCVVKDQPYPGADGRPDCVLPCMVLEFKPNNARAIAKGKNKQLPRYVDAVEKYYLSALKGNTVPSSDLGGKEMVEAIGAKCFDGTSVEFGSDVMAYKMCEKKYTCE